jgi:hypothetical protein
MPGTAFTTVRKFSQADRNTQVAALITTGARKRD